MKPTLLLPVSLLALGTAFILPASTRAEAPAAKPAATPGAPAKPAPAPLEPADQPSFKKERPKDGVVSTNIDPGFKAQHENFLKRGKDPIGVVFLGDSITAGWGGKGKQVWDEYYSKYQPANFGIGGDKTQHVLWRIANGELDNIHPKVLVLMIGTNNIGYPADDIIKGDLKIVDEIHKKLSDTKVLVLGIFPRAAEPTNAMRAKIKTVNAALAKLDDGKKTRYLDIGDKFLDASGNLPKEIMPDYLHPNADGYKIWAKATQPLLDEMMK